MHVKCTYWQVFPSTLFYFVILGTADDELWPIIQKKLDVLNKAGLSKDNFKDSESHTVSNAASSSNGDSKITDYFSTSFTEEDIAALDDEWNGKDKSPEVPFHGTTSSNSNFEVI